MLFTMSGPRPSVRDTAASIRYFLNDSAAEGARHRNCNVNLDDLGGVRPDLDCEPQLAPGASLAIFNWTRQSSVRGEGCTVRV